MSDTTEPVKKTPDWMDPLNRIIWRAAFAKKAKLVTLRDGRKFTVEYDPKDAKDAGMCWVSPAQGSRHPLVPCGWFHYKEIEKNGEWISAR